MISNIKKYFSLRIKKMKKRVFFMLLASYICLLFLAMIATYAFFVQSDSESREQAQTIREAVLHQLVSETGFRFDQVQTVSNKVLFDAQLEYFLGGSPLASYSELQEVLSAAAETSEEVFDVYCYLIGDDMIVTPNILMNSKTFFTSIYDYGELSYTDWRADLLHNYFFADYSPAQPLSYIAGGRPRDVVIYKQSAPLRINSEAAAQIVIFYDVSVISDSIAEAKEATGADFYIIDGEGETIFSSADQPLSDYVVESVAVGSGDFYSEQDRTMVSYEKNAEVGFTVVMSMDRDVYYSTLRELRVRFFMQFMLLLVIGLVLSYYFSSRNYKPIREIVDMIDENSEGNEFANIKSSITRSIEQREQLERTLSEHETDMRKVFFLQRLSGIEAITQDDVQAQESRLVDELKSLGITPCSDKYVVVALTLDIESGFFAEGEVRTNLDLAMGWLIINNIGSELFEDAGIQATFVEVGKNIAAFVINLRPALPDYNKVSEAAARLLAATENYFSLSFYGGFGAVHTGLTQLCESFDEARKGADYSAISAKHGLTHYEKIVDLDSDYFYPIETEIQLTNLLRVGDGEHAAQIIESVIEVNFERRSINAAAAKCLAVELSGTLVKVMNSMLAQNGQDISATEDLQQRIVEKSSYGDIKKELLKLVEEITAISQTRQSNQTERLVNRIERFIINSDDWLDLATIASEFDITPQYLSTVFKKYKNENVKEYISKMRLEKAKGMLCETNMTIDEIAKKLGYANETGLNRLFKKYEGITPGAFRKSRKGGI